MAKVPENVNYNNNYCNIFMPTSIALFTAIHHATGQQYRLGNPSQPENNDPMPI